MSDDQKKTGRGRIKRYFPPGLQESYDPEKHDPGAMSKKRRSSVMLPIQGKATGATNQAVPTSKSAAKKAVEAANGKSSLTAPDKANDLLAPVLLELINDPNPKPPQTKQHSGVIATNQVLGSVEEDSPSDDGDQEETDDADDEPGEEVVEPPFVDGGQPSDAAPDFALSYVEAGFDKTLVPGWAKQIAKNGNEMMVLGQIAYWFGKIEAGPRKGQRRASKLLGQEGYYWVAKSHEELGRETGLDKRQVRHAIEKLAKRGIIVKLVRRFGGYTLSHLRLDIVVIENLLKATPAPAEDHGDDEEL